MPIRSSTEDSWDAARDARDWSYFFYSIMRLLEIILGNGSEVLGNG